MQKDKCFRTDLALESAQLLMNNSALGRIDGISMDVEMRGKDKSIKQTVVQVTSENGAEQIGKPVGTYITIESDRLRENDTIMHEQIIELMAQNLAGIAQLKRDASVLIVGLGNWNVTPDALGPKVVSKALITRHIMDELPKELVNSTRAVSAISPGVMGLTGMETGEIVKGIVDNIQPDIIFAVDALAARSVGRINTAIQISDTGLSPGSGLGNIRMSISKEALGVPVIGIGVPTVVDAATLVNDTLDKIIGSMMNELAEGSQFLDMLGNLESGEKYMMIRDLLEPHSENMFVAPKEVDSVIEYLSNIIANSINIAIHPGIEINDMNRYIY